MDWQPISTAPFDRVLQLAVISYDGVHALAFPCGRILRSWIDAETKERVDVRPTHWRLAGTVLSAAPFFLQVGRPTLQFACSAANRQTSICRFVLIVFESQFLFDISYNPVL